MLGAGIVWKPVTLEEARASMPQSGPEVFAGGFTEIHARYREGGVTALVSPAVRQLLGRPARSFERFVRDHREAVAPRVAA